MEIRVLSLIKSLITGRNKTRLIYIIPIHYLSNEPLVLLGSQGPLFDYTHTVLEHFVRQEKW